MIQENDKDYKITFDALGLGKEDINVEVDGDKIIVTSEKKDYFNSLNYRRVVWLSDDTDKENISATCDKGLLTITVPKKKDKQRRRIEVE